MFYSTAGVLKPEELSKLEGKKIENKDVFRGTRFLVYFVKWHHRMIQRYYQTFKKSSIIEIFSAIHKLNQFLKFHQSGICDKLLNCIITGFIYLYILILDKTDSKTYIFKCNAYMQ